MCFGLRESAGNPSFFRHVPREAGHDADASAMRPYLWDVKNMPERHAKPDVFRPSRILSKPFFSSSPPAWAGQADGERGAKGVRVASGLPPIAIDGQRTVRGGDCQLSRTDPEGVRCSHKLGAWASKTVHFRILGYFSLDNSRDKSGPDARQAG